VDYRHSDVAIYISVDNKKIGPAWDAGPGLDWNVERVWDSRSFVVEEDSRPLI
jgi:hypothetical protein